MIQSSHTDNDQLKGKIRTLKKVLTNLMNKTQSMTEGAETLTERIHIVECIIIRDLLNRYDILMDRVSLRKVICTL